MADDPEVTPAQADAMIRSRPYLGLLAIAGVVGLVASLASWCFLELIYQLQQGVYKHLPETLGFHDGAPIWWSVPFLALAGVITAFAILRLPGSGGHSPAQGLAGGTLPAVDVPGVVLAGLATIGLGVVLGPEAPLIALGAGVGLFLIAQAKRDVPDQAVLIIGGAGSFAAVSLIFGSPLIAAVIIIEATGIGGQKMRLMLLPGLIGAAVGSLVSTGMGSLTGLSSSAYALGALDLPTFTQPQFGDFGWSIALAVVVAIGSQLIMRGGRHTETLVAPRRWLAMPLIGVVIGCLAIAFNQATGKSVYGVLFDGQNGLPQLVADGPTWPVWVLLLLLLFKGVAYMLSLGSFRGGPTFPALFLGGVAGVMASHLPGYSLTPAIAVGMGAATVSVLGLPLSAVVLATLLGGKAGVGAEALIIVGVVASYVTVRLMPASWVGHAALIDQPQATPAASEPATAAA